MEFAFDRYLDDGRALHLTLGLRSRTTEMHSVLSSLDAEERAAVGAALTQALDRVAAILRARVAAEAR